MWYVLVLQKERGGDTPIRDYMKALHLRFENPSRQTLELEQRADTLRKQLASRQAKPERRMLLRLVDLENELRGRSDLDSFMSGFRLADGIHQELMEQPPYSFELENERCACERLERRER